MRALLFGACVIGVLQSAGLSVQSAVLSWGTAIRLAGEEERVESVVLSNFPAGALTLSLWLKVDDASSETALVSYAAEGPCVSVFSVRHPANLMIDVGCQSRTTGIALQDSRWHHLAVTWQSAGGLVEVFLDGELAFEDQGFQAGYVLTGGGTLVLGQQQMCPGGCFGEEPGFRGVIDELLIWDHARGVGQIQVDLQRTAIEPEPGLVLAWSCDEGRFGSGAGALVRDVSGWGNDGWLRNRPMRQPSQPQPFFVLLGDDPFIVECHDAYEEPGATMVGAPVTVAAGYAHSLGLRADGRIVGWGSNDAGQLRIDSTAKDVVAIAAGARHSLALHRDGRVTAWGDNAWGQVSVPAEVTNAVAIAAGTVHSLALLREGRVFAWGHPDAGTAVIPEEATNVVAVAAGSLFSLALRGDGEVVAWGRDDYGQLRVPTEATNVIAIAASYRHALALRRDGTVIGWGTNAEGQVDVPGLAMNVVAIAAGYGHSLALRGDGRVVAWGDNREGQCEVPELDDRAVAIAAGGNHSLALLVDGTVQAWGRAEEGALEVPDRLGVLDATIEIQGIVDVEIPGDYEKRYSASLGGEQSWSAQRVVTVVDTTAPVVELLADNPLLLEVGSVFVPPDAMATDACAGDLTGQLAVAGEVDTAVVGAYELTYSVIDPSGNSNAVEWFVWVAGAPGIESLKAVLTGTEGARSARLEGEVKPNGLEGSTWFELGMGEDYSDQTEPVMVPGGYDVHGVTADLVELEPGALIQYRLVASNAVGVTTSSDRVLRVPGQFVPGDANGDGMVDQAELDAVLAHYWPYSPWLAMTNVTSWGEGTFQFALTNSTAWMFSVEVSTNALDWEALGVAVPVYQFRDSEATNQPQRFYRLRWP